MKASELNFVPLKTGRITTLDGISLNKSASFVVGKAFAERIRSARKALIEIDPKNKAIAVTVDPKNSEYSRALTRHDTSTTISGASSAVQVGMPRGKYYYVSNIGPDKFLLLHQSVNIHN